MTYAQTVLPRLFLDIPAFSVGSPDVERIQNRAGLNLGTAMNFGTHWGVARVGGGAWVTVDPKSHDIGKSFITTPYALIEAGAGKYRTNGNQCAKNHANAFTAMAKAGIRYSFDTRKDVPEDDPGTGYGIDYTVGAEFSYFYIRDVFKNIEVFIDANYMTQSKIIMANFGFKTFLNLRADRS